jgi:Domain of unknown function (DUF4191)
MARKFMARKKVSTPEGTPEPKKPSRTAQIRSAYRMTRKVDRWVGWITAGAFFGALAAAVAIGLLVGHPIYVGVMGAMLGILGSTVVFGRRAEKAAYAQVEGQPGAAAAALNMLRKGWTVTPAVAVTRNQDLVHRAVGRPGVVLIAEGGSNRLPSLLAQEKKKVERFVPDVPIYEVQAGNEAKQVPLRKLNRHLMKLPRNLKADRVSEVNRRLKAVGGMNLPIPKGPMPKGMRMPKGPRP